MWRKIMLYRPTWAEINLDFLIKNYEYAKQKAYPKTIIPVIKADAYGHGAVKIMEALYQKGVTFFAVSLLEEAVELRTVNKRIGILILGPILPHQFDICHKHKLSITVYDEEIAKALLAFDKPLTFHMKIDTGMHRYGLTSWTEVHQLMDKFQTSVHVMEGIYTHFATANEQNELYYHQIAQFEELLNSLAQKPPMIHVSNSSSTLKYEDHIPWTTHARLGISLYGLSLDEDKTHLHPVMSLKSQVVQIKTLQKGDTVGYGATYKAFLDTERIAVIPIGYADGFIRRNKTGHVQIGAKLYPIVGIICMDACFIKVDQDVSVGDEVIIFGDLISIDDVARRLSTINYEVVCQLSKRVPRVYVRGGNV